jgi:putative hydroxymethylpyrimidine transport system substrate-binding protein
VTKQAVRILAAALALAALAAVAAGCGSKKESTTPSAAQPFELVLDFFPNADHAGIYAAQAHGDFRREGLDVRLRAPSDPAAPLKLLEAGRADLAISYEPEVLLARDRGLQVVAVGAIVQRPLTSVIAIGQRHITSLAQLKGKRVGTAGIPYQSAYLKTILRRAGVDPASVNETNVGFNLVPAMLSGKVDATLGGFWNYEGIQLAQQKKHPTVIPVDRAGVPTYDELVFVATRKAAREKGNEIRRFLRAVTAGYQSARRDPAAAVKALVASNRDLDPKLQLASVKATPFFPAGGRPFGYQDARLWAAYGDWMLRNQLLTRPPNAGDALTNEFLPGQGV